MARNRSRSADMPSSLGLPCLTAPSRAPIRRFADFADSRHGLPCLTAPSRAPIRRFADFADSRHGLPCLADALGA